MQKTLHIRIQGPMLSRRALARARRDKDQCNEPKIQPLVKNKNATSSNATLPNTINGQYKITVIGAACDPANSCSYGLSREPYTRFTRGLFYRDRREKLSLAHQCANSGAQNCSPENFISDFLLCPQCKAVLTKAHTTKTRRGHPTEF